MNSSLSSLKNYLLSKSKPVIKTEKSRIYVGGSYGRDPNELSRKQVENKLKVLRRQCIEENKKSVKIKSDIADTIKETNELQESFASVNQKLMTM